MTNDNDDFGPEFWMHVLTDATARYVSGGGMVDIQETASGITITLLGIDFSNELLSQKFTDLMEVQK